MALLDPADTSALSTKDRDARRDADDTTNHPALCLLGGFGVIMAAALVVHVLFNTVL